MLNVIPDMYLSRSRCLLGLLVNGVGVLGGEELAVYLRVQVPKARGPDPTLQELPEAVSFYQLRLHIVIHLMMPSAHNSEENDVGICIHYK